MLKEELEEWLNGMETIFCIFEWYSSFDPTNNSWLTSWTPSNGGMPSSGDEDVYSMKVIGDDLWVGTYAQNGWQTNSDVHTLNGTTGQWSSTAAGSGNLPSGYPADFAVCADIVHVAMGYLGWWAPVESVVMIQHLQPGFLISVLKAEKFPMTMSAL